MYRGGPRHFAPCWALDESQENRTFPQMDFAPQLTYRKEHGT